MRVDDIYPDKFLRAKHLEDMNPTADHYTFTIRGSEVVKFPDGKQQLGLHLSETMLILGLNKGNATCCAEAFGSDDSDDWVGKRLVVHIEDVKNSFAPSGVGPAIRVSLRQTKIANAPKPAKSASQKPAPAMTQAEVDSNEDDGEPPF